MEMGIVHLHKIKMEFLALKKNLKKDFTKLRIVKIALLGDSTTQMLSQALKGYGYDIGLNFEIFEAGHNQIEKEILNPSSELYDFKPEFIIIFHSSQKIQKTFYQLPTAEKTFFAEAHIQKIETLYQTLQAKHPARVVYFNLAETDDSIYGNYANKTEVSFLYQLRKINFKLMNASRQLKNLFILDISRLQSNYGNDFIYDPRLYINADMVFSIDFLPLVAKNTADIVIASSGMIKKCLIIDLDNIIWGGIVGDDGIDKIQLGNLGVGKAFTDLQYWVKELKQRGILLAVCSKNDEQTAKSVFEKHPDMILKLDDIAVFVANWNNKIDNIKYIQSILNISYDSMVFLDDTAFERNFVRSHFPEITVPELPEDPAEYLPYLQKLNLFETTSLTGDNLQRTEKYQEEAKRKNSATQFTSETEFLQSTEMIADIENFSSFNIPRIAELVERSNQFNLRTIRYSEEEIKKMTSSGNHFTLSFSLKDKFGDYGLISAVILKKEEDFLFIDTWIMSCRVFKRGMENLILNQIAQVATDNGYKEVKGEYIKTVKNNIVKDLYQNYNFEEEGNLWRLNLKKFQPLEHQIKIKNNFSNNS
jgi:FkbH-like protein